MIVLIYTTQMNSQPQILTLFYEIGKNLRETEREAILFCLEVNIWVANQSARKSTSV